MGDSNIPHYNYYYEKFYEVFPYYLSIGMTYDQFWNQSPELVKYYRKAQRITNDRRNQELWLQGLYVYRAIESFVPVLITMPEKGAKPSSYLEEPIPLTEQQRIEQEIKQAKRKMQEGIGYMMGFVKGGAKNG